MKASHALMTLMSILLMGLAFSHPLPPGQLFAAAADSGNTQDRQVDPNVSPVAHVIVPAKELLRKAQASRPQPKKWHPSGPPVLLALAGTVTPLPGERSAGAIVARTVDQHRNPPAGPANTARAPPSHPFSC